eukprot:5801065-Prorocentrum_lima.AAC.1
MVLQFHKRPGVLQCSMRHVIAGRADSTELGKGCFASRRLQHRGVLNIEPLHPFICDATQVGWGVYQK